jgi:hypothetical protein
MDSPEALVRLPDGRQVRLTRRELQDLKAEICEAERQIEAQQLEAFRQRNYDLFQDTGKTASAVKPLRN